MVIEMKKNIYLLFFLLLFFPIIANASTECNYSNGLTLQDEFSATIEIKKGILGNYYGVGTVKNYDGEEKNESGRVTVKNWDKGHDKCYTYASINTVRRLSGNQYKLTYHIYVSDNEDDLKNESGVIMTLLGSDASINKDQMTNSCELNYYNGFQDDDRKSDKIVDAVKFKFYTYSSGTREFCVSTNNQTSCEKFQNSEVPTISAIGKSGTSYQFTINKNKVDAFYSDSCVTNTRWTIDTSSSVFTLDYSGQVLPSAFNPKKLCEEAENCNISLANFCTTPTVARTLKFLGLLFYIAKILVPGIIIVMGFVNLFNIMTSGKLEDAKKYGKSIVIRIFVGIGIFLLPGIINTIYDGAKTIIGGGGTGGFDNCVSCLLEPNSDECYIEEN